MGIGIKELEVLDDLLDFSKGGENRTLLELGNNYVKGKEALQFLEAFDLPVELGGEQHQGMVPSYKFWTALNYSHVSIDLNGLDFALKVDLREEITQPMLLDMFDIVYDGGTGEHVDNQYNFFKNVHNCTKVGGLMIHLLPEVGSFPDHCSYYYTLESFGVLRRLMGYDSWIQRRHATGDNVMVYSVMQKLDSRPFMTKEEFDEIPIHHTGKVAKDAVLYPYLRK